MPILFDNINILLLVVAILNLFLGSIVFFHGKKKITNTLYSINILSLIGWILGMFFYRSASPESGIFWCTILYVAATFIPSIFLYFTCFFPTRDKKKIIQKSIIILLLNISVILMIVWPGLIIKEVNIRPGLEKEIIFTQYYWFYFIYIFSLFNYSFFRLYKKFIQSVGIERYQILYVFLGVFFSTIPAFATNLVLPWLGYFSVNWLGQVCTIIMVTLTAYAILRYRLMDIRIVARKIFIFLGVAVFVYGAYYLTTWLYLEIFGGVFVSGTFLLGLLIAPVFALGFYGVDKGMKILANKYLFVSLYNYQETINNLTDELADYIDLDKIINLIVDTIKKTMQLDRAGVLLVNTEVSPIHYQVAKVVGFNESNGISLVQDNFLTKYLYKTKKPLVSDELIMLARDAKSPKDRQSFASLHEHMSHIEASLCLPLISNKKLIGIIVLGSKISNDAYTQDDLELLNTLSKQAGVTIENARQHKQIKEFGKTLQGKVDEQTKDLQQANNELEVKNRLNQELLAMKSDFLRVVNHQLNTPISIMRGYFSMLKEGDYQPKKALPAIETGLDRITQTVADFWNAYELEGERMKMNPERVAIATVVDKLIEEKKDLKYFKDRKLSIMADKPAFKLPIVWCDLKKISHVVSNLLDNAVFYTYKGGIKVSYVLAGDYLKINIKDSGSGINEEDKKKIFKKFSRGTGASGMHPDGSGLGLYISKKIVEGNGGEITFDSAGDGQGTTFSFTIPLYANQQSGVLGKAAAKENKIEIYN